MSAGIVQHLVILPIVLPFFAGALLMVLGEQRRLLKAIMSTAALALLLASAVALVMATADEGVRVYRLGDWPSRFGIALVADRLSASMVLLASILGIAAQVFSVARWHREGPHFHSLVQFLIMGLNGAFLTGDLFNLFVFFELLLAASYGLALHGSGAARVRASLHYIVINLTASLCFLVGVSLLYGITGTLNIADLALRIRWLAPADRVLAEAGAATLGIAFLVKAGMWPLGFWLSPTYSAACAPAAALLSILSKMGIYAVVRLWLTLFGGAVGHEVLLIGAIATIAYGTIGVLSAQSMGRLAGNSLLVSAGTVLAGIAFTETSTTAASLYYLLGSTLGISAFYLLIELVERVRPPGADVLAVTAELFDDASEGAQDSDALVGIPIPAPITALAIAFACCALLIAGLPPLPGFLAKFALLRGVLSSDPISPAAWGLTALLVISGLSVVIGMGRIGIRVFWSTSERRMPRIRLIEMGPVMSLLLLCMALTVFAGPVMEYLQEAARALHSPDAYLHRTLAP